VSIPLPSPDAVGIRVNGIVIDANELDRIAEFWSRLLNLPITRREANWISLGPHLAIQRVPESKSVKNRVHLDLIPDDYPAAVALATRLGATPAGPMLENLWQVWQDPEGNEFCLCVS
jgi:Glyoxalase-like domain